MKPYPILIAALLCGCALQQPYERPEVPLPQAWRHEAPAQPAAGEWWSAFGSEELARLARAAEANNRDLAAAARRVEQARASLRVAGASLYPTLDASAGATRTRTGRADAASSLQALGAASYEIDVWGRNRLGRDAAAASLEASGFAREALRVSVMADAATAYFQALSAADRIASARRQIEIATSLLQLLEVQWKAGAISQIEVERQRNLLASVEASIPPLVQQREQSLDALAVLLGQPPRELSLSATSLAPLILPRPEAGLPASLLARRPDIRRAEADLVAADADLGAARAAMLPSIDLTARAGLQGATLSGLAGPGAGLWSLAAALAAPMFDGGRLAGQRDLAQARRDERVEQYRQTVLVALRDVEDALVSVDELARQQAAQERALAHAREAYRLSEIRWRAGAIDFTSVLDAQRQLISSESALDPIRLAQFNAAVSLFRALGGDFAAP